MSDDLIITMKDLRRIGMWCRAREFAHAHGIDWVDFLKHGVSASRLEATGDALALKIVEEVRRGR